MCENQKILQRVVDLVTEFPNDTDLGQAVRKRITIDLKILKNEIEEGQCDCVCRKEPTAGNDREGVE